MRALVIALSMIGQCPGGVCYPQSVGIPQAASVVQTPTVWKLADDGGQVWTSPDADWLRKWVAIRNDSIRSGRSASPSVPAAKPEAATANYGLDLSKIPHVAKEWYGGNLPQGEPVVGAGDASSRLHLTVVGRGAHSVVGRWRRESREFEAAEAGMGDRLSTKSYEPGEKSYLVVAGLGFEAGGNPDITLQDGSGKVLARWRDDPGGDSVAGELRRRDPNYSPGRDPFPSSFSSGFLGVPVWGWVGAGVLLLLLGGVKQK